jgi:radical SAM superfamily enzyme YgiQ (UPF0313 family)
VLQAHDYEVIVLDLWIGDAPARRLANTLLRLTSRPLAVGITVYTESARDCVRMQRLVRQLAPEATIILGGPHVTAVFGEAMANPDTDVVVRGEGESTIIEVLEAIRHPAYGLNRVKGIVYRDPSGQVRSNPDRPPICVLDQLPIPAYDLANYTTETRWFSLVSSRGCPGRCVFCAAHVTAGCVPRSHTVEWMYSTLYSQHRRHRFRFFSILDDTFTADRRRVHAFCNLLRAWAAGVQFAVRTRVDLLDEEMVRALAVTGCAEVQIGIESGDDAVLRSIGKNITLAQVRRAIELILMYRILLDTSFILGHPSDTLETLDKTILLAMAIREFGHSAGVGISTPFPGTPLERQAAEFGIRIIDRDWRRYTVLTQIYDAPGFTFADISKAQIFFQSATFSTLPETLLSGNPHRELRAELVVWIREMQRVRALASQPVSADGGAGAGLVLP